MDAVVPRAGTRTLLFLLLAVSHAALSADVEQVRSRFETSCQPDVAAEFDLAVTLLHSFEYPETTRLFGEIMAADPGCAMAKWGLAMSLWHPLWAPPSPAELAEGAAILAGTEGMAMTAREQGYVAALRAFYADTDPLNHRVRAQAYEDRMRDLYESHRDDLEAAVFYALSLLATQDPHDKSYAHQFKAAGLLNRVRESEPYHPGVLHYIIHSYDYPGLAELALGAATVYAEAAPDSAHAQHMPSHIFTRLGLWERSIASNHDSTASATAYTERAHLPGHYDEGLHSIDYLMYAMLQTARDDEAYRLLQRLSGITKADVDTFKVAYTYAASPARYALERHQWAEASRLALGPETFPWDEFAWAQSIHHFARGVGAARSGQLDRAREERDTIRALGRTLSDATLPYWAEEVAVQADIVAAWIALAEGDGETALSTARAAADREDAVDKHPVTPGEVLPARELLADLLFELGQNAAALVEYRSVLDSSPNRYNSLLGAARSAARAGQQDEARDYYAQLVEVAAHAGPGRDSLAEARAWLAGQDGVAAR